MYRLKFRASNWLGPDLLHKWWSLSSHLHRACISDRWLTCACVKLPICYRRRRQGTKGCCLHVIGDPCLGKLWPADSWQNIIDHLGIRIASGSWPLANNESVSSSGVWVINNTAHLEAEDLQTIPHSCLLQPLTNEHLCHLVCHREEKIEKLREDSSLIGETLLIILCFVCAHVVCMLDLYRLLLILKGMQICPDCTVLKSRRQSPAYITTQI